MTLSLSLPFPVTKMLPGILGRSNVTIPLWNCSFPLSRTFLSFFPLFLFFFALFIFRLATIDTTERIKKLRVSCHPVFLINSEIRREMDDDFDEI